MSLTLSGGDLSRLYVSKAYRMKNQIVNSMKYLKISIVTLWCSSLVCTKSFAQNSFWYNFKGTASLTINYVNNSDQKIWHIFTYKMFPDQEVRLSDTIPAGSGNRKYLLPIGLSQKVTLKTNGKELTLLLTPGSTLVCNLDFKNLSRSSIDAPDSLRAINEYLIKKDLSVATSFKTRRTLAAQRSATLEEFGTKMTELYLEELQFFNANKDGLPRWYQNFEYWENRYSDATGRMNAPLQRELSRQIKDSIPSTYYRFLDSLALNNDAAKYSYPYYLFLYELFNKRMADYDLEHGSKSDYLDYHIEQANKELSGEALDLFKAFTIQLVFNHYKREVAKNYINNHDSIFSNTVWLDELKSSFQSKDNQAGKGKIPPNFVLTDSRDSLIWLRSLKGNIIVLSFWFAGCKPCIEEFPAENRLADTFKDRPVRIVSVCVNTSEEMWRKWSERFGLKTINLWANSQWEKTIIERYGLTVFPRYILIDKDYKIVETYADRPSQGLERQIKSLLRN